MGQHVEGQQIALDILDARPGAWDRLLEAYGERLLARAQKLIAACPALRQNLQAIDLVQDFLTVKVLHRPQVMFRPVANGQQPLWPRLCCSLTQRRPTAGHRDSDRSSGMDEEVSPRKILFHRSSSGGPSSGKDYERRGRR